MADQVQETGSASPPGVIRFGPFEADLRAGDLRKFGIRIPLRDQSFQLLAILLESRGEVVRREDIRRRLWPENTFVEFDHSINTAVKRLRQALGESAEAPVYIETLAKRGYRFRGTVEAAGSEGPAASAPVPIPELRRRSGRRILMAAGTVIALAVLAIGVRPGASQFHDRDWVLISRFDNRTGEKLLDGTMEAALESELSRSSYLNVAPTERVRDALILMRQKPSVELTEDLARQAAVRDGGIKAVISGRIEKLDTKYLLTVRVVSSAAGTVMATFDREAGRAQLLQAVQSLAGDLRRNLGEPALKTAGLPERLERATTTSLEALRAFTAGMTLVNERKWGPAAELLEESTNEDPQFALAHIYAAHSLANMGQSERAAPHFTAAGALAPGVTERERLFILGSYYGRFQHDDARAIAMYEALTRFYPDDYWGTNNLLSTYQRLGKAVNDPGVLALRVRLVELRPNEIRHLSDLLSLWVYYRRARLDKAKARQFKEQLIRLRDLARGLPADGFLSDESLLEESLQLEDGLDKWWASDVRRAAGEFDKFAALAMVHGDDDLLKRASGLQLAIGKNKSAQALCDKLQDFQSRNECLLRVGMARQDRQMTEESLSNLRLGGTTRGGLVGDAFVALSYGHVDLAQEWVRQTPPSNGELIAAILEGRVASLPQIALGLQGASWFNLYRRMAVADALEAKGKTAEAIAKLGDDTRPAAVDLMNCWNWPQCRLQLAELYRKHGHAEQAVLVEQEIRHYLSAADPDHPILARLPR